MACKDDRSNISLIASSLDTRFLTLKFLSSNEGLKLKIQALVLEKTNVSEMHTTEVKESTNVTEKKPISLLNTLLVSDSEDTSSQIDSGDEADNLSHSVREEILRYFGEQSVPKSTDPLQW